MWPFASEKKPARPSFSRAIEFKRRLPNCTISVVAPRGDGHQPSDRDTDVKLDIQPELTKIVKGSEGEIAYRYEKVLFLSWKIRGAPIFSSTVGEVGFSIRLIESPWLGVNESLFDPNVLLDCLRKEFIAVNKDRIYTLAGENDFDLSDYRVPRYLEKVCCQWGMLSGVPVFYAEDIGLRDSIHDISYIIPIDDNRYLKICGTIWRSVDNGGNYYRIAQRVPISPLREVVDKIVSSFKIEPSSELLARFKDLTLALEREAPRLAPSPEYIYSAKSAIKRSSSFGFRPPKNLPDEVSPTEASNFIDEFLKPHPIPGSYGFDGPVIYVYHPGDLSPVPTSFRKEVPPPWEQ